ncbi:MAG: hypothetical protein F6K32_21710 [Desertifilum sp. SIO1I2]|nr:hypothetical protein [Desertifilum sp. SIO1I2]
MEYLFIQHLQISETQLQQFLASSLEDLLASPKVQALLASLDVPLLQQTLPTAGEVLAQQLPPFYHWLKTELGLKRVPDGPDHTTRWVVNFLNNQESVMRLVELHRPVPQPALEAAVPRLVGLFDGVEEPKVRSAWQQSIAALCLILVVAARSEAALV